MKYTTVEAIMNRATDKVREKLYTPEMQLRDLGIAEGMVQKARETARKMKAEGVALDLIHRVTDLSFAEIEAL